MRRQGRLEIGAEIRGQAQRARVLEFQFDVRPAAPLAPHGPRRRHEHGLHLERRIRGDHDLALLVGEHVPEAAVPEHLAVPLVTDEALGLPLHHQRTRPEDPVVEVVPGGIAAEHRARPLDVVRGPEDPVGSGMKADGQPVARISTGAFRLMTGPAGHGVVTRELLFPEEDLPQKRLLRGDRILGRHRERREGLCGCRGRDQEEEPTRAIRINMIHGTASTAVRWEIGEWEIVPPSWGVKPTNSRRNVNRSSVGPETFESRRRARPPRTRAPSGP